MKEARVAADVDVAGAPGAVVNVVDAAAAVVVDAVAVAVDVVAVAVAVVVVAVAVAVAAVAVAVAVVVDGGVLSGGDNAETFRSRVDCSASGEKEQTKERETEAVLRAF